jgi:hypothetical protein
VSGVGVEHRVGSIEKDKFGDPIAVNSDPFSDVTEMQRVMFVMKRGMVVRNDFASSGLPTALSNRAGQSTRRDVVVCRLLALDAAVQTA